MDSINKLIENASFFTAYEKKKKELDQLLEDWEKVQEDCTHAEAYQYVEDQLNMYGLPPRYSSYESFKRGKAYFWDKSEPVLRFF